MKKFLLLLLVFGFTTNAYAKDLSKEIIPPNEMTVKDFFTVDFSKAANEKEGEKMGMNVGMVIGNLAAMKFRVTQSKAVSKRELDCIEKLGGVESMQSDFENGKLDGNEKVSWAYAKRLMKCLKPENQKRMLKDMQELLK